MSRTSPEPEILQTVIAFALRQLNEAEGGSPQDQAAALLGPWGQVSAFTRHGFLVRSSSREDADRCRAVLRLASDTMIFPAFLRLPAPGNCSLVIPSQLFAPGLASRLFIWLAAVLLIVFGHLSTDTLIFYGAYVLLLGLVGHSMAMNRRRTQLDFQVLLKAGLSELRNHQELLALAGKEQQYFNTVRDLLPEAEYQFRHTADLPAVYAQLVTFLRRLFPEADGLSLWIMDQAEEYLEVVHATGRHFHLLTPRARHTWDKGATGHSLETRRPYYVRDFLSDPHVLPYLPGPAESGLAIPLWTSEARIGAAMLSGMAREIFTDHRVWAAEVLAGLAALRIQALKDRSRAQKLLDDFGRLHDLVNQSDVAPSGALLERLATRLQAAVGSNAYATFTVGPGGELEHGPCLAPTEEMQCLLLALPPDRTPAPITVAGSKVRSFCREGLRTFGPAILEALPVNECVCVPITRGDGAAIAVVLLLFLGLARAVPGPDMLALSELYARFGGIAVHNLELFATTARQSQELRQLLGRVVEAQEAERRRIAMDLHDWVVQGLAAPAFQLQLVERLLEPTQANVKAELDVARGQLNAAGDELRRIMKGLRPYLLDELGLFRAVQAYADDWSKSHPIACTVSKDPNAELPRGSEEGLVAFRIVQEALNNVAKHADATQVQITISRVSDRVQVRIRDNGNGFQPGAIREQEHFGLLGMHERAASVGGSLEVSRPPEGGCLVVCSIPIPA